MSSVKDKDHKKKSKTVFAFKCEAHDSTKERIPETPSKDHEDHFVAKGSILRVIFELMHKHFLVPQAIKIPDTKAAIDKQRDKLKSIPACQDKKSKSKKETS